MTNSYTLLFSTRSCHQGDMEHTMIRQKSPWMVRHELAAVNRSQFKACLRHSEVMKQTRCDEKMLQRQKTADA